MTATLRMPRLGETMEEGVVTAWLVTPGQPFARGDALLEVETDKMAVEFPALGPGTLVETLVGIGARVRVGAPIARIELGTADDWTADETVLAQDAGSEPAGGAAAGQAQNAGAQKTGPAQAVEAAGGRLIGDPATGAGQGRQPFGDRTGSLGGPDAAGDIAAGAGPVRATPLARRAARAAGVDLAGVHGTGRRGRIDLRDIGGQGDGDGFSGDIAYAVSGPAGGTPVLLLHGFGADRTAWAVLAAGLARAGMRVFAADLPGHGATRAEATEAAALGRGFGRLIARAGGRPHVVAHSLGAVAALALAGGGVAASLTLIAPVGIGLSIDAAFVRGLAAPGSAGEVAHLLRRLSDRPLALSPAAVDGLFRDLSRGRLRMLADSIVSASGQTLDLVPAIAAAVSELPVRVIVGHRDRITDWRDVGNLPSRVAVHHMVQAGHVPHWDAPAEVLNILGAFS